MIHGCGAQPAARITAVVEPGGEMAVAAAEPNGCFVVRLAPRSVMTFADEAVSISLRVDSQYPSTSLSSRAAPFATATGVLFGHTILCSGQSNMVHPLSYDYNATEQISAAHLLPNLRLFQVGRLCASSKSTSHLRISHRQFGLKFSARLIDHLNLATLLAT